MRLLAFAVFAFVMVGFLLTILILFVHRIFSVRGVCSIRINEEPGLTKSVEAGQTLLHALTKQGIPIPSPCGGRGVCKQCRIRITEGAGDPLDTDSAAFTQQQLREGWRLSCQVRVANDMAIHIDEQLLQVREWKAEVISNENVATFIKELVLKLPEGMNLGYRAGGYAEIYAPSFRTSSSVWKSTIDESFWSEWEKCGMSDVNIDFSSHPEEKRAYSFASYPGEQDVLKFNVRIATPPLQGGKISSEIPWGFCSSYLFSLKKGDVVRLSGPYGVSYMKKEERDVVFLVGGAGSSFGRSHIMQLFREEKTKRKVFLWYGARSLKENIYQKEYERLEKEFPNFFYHLVLSEPTEEDKAKGWPLLDPVKTNFLFKAFELGQLKEMQDPEECLFYVCGPPLHNKSVMRLLDDYGIPREHIVLDDFCGYSVVGQ
jgi:Na+-transporting NADH:ubiquinone oxidoreductase subunit F